MAVSLKLSYFVDEIVAAWDAFQASREKLMFKPAHERSAGALNGTTMLADGNSTAIFNPYTIGNADAIGEMLASRLGEQDSNDSNGVLGDYGYCAITFLPSKYGGGYRATIRGRVNDFNNWADCGYANLHGIAVEPANTSDHGWLRFVRQQLVYQGVVFVPENARQNLRVKIVALLQRFSSHIR